MLIASISNSVTPQNATPDNSNPQTPNDEPTNNSSKNMVLKPLSLQKPGNVIQESDSQSSNNNNNNNNNDNMKLTIQPKYNKDRLSTSISVGGTYNSNLTTHITTTENIMNRNSLGFIDNNSKEEPEIDMTSHTIVPNIWGRIINTDSIDENKETSPNTTHFKQGIIFFYFYCYPFLFCCWIKK